MIKEFYKYKILWNKSINITNLLIIEFKIYNIFDGLIFILTNKEKIKYTIYINKFIDGLYECEI